MSKTNLLRTVFRARALVVLAVVILTIGNVLGLVLRDAGRDASQAGQHVKGLRLLMLASFLAPLNAAVWQTRCEAYDSAKYADELAAEISTCKRAVWLDPDPNSGVHRDLVFAYVNAREYGKAAASFAPLANHNDESTSLAFINRPYVVSLLLAKDYQSAILGARRILQIEKGYSEEIISEDKSLLGMAYEGTGNSELARVAFGANKTCRITEFTSGNISTSCYAR